MRNKKRIKSLLTTILVIFIGFAGYLGFKPIFESISGGALKEFMVAIYGTIFTVILTMFLLNKQTEIEEQKERGQSVFIKKSVLFSKIIDKVRRILEDEKITQNELNDLRFLLLELHIFTDDKTIEKFTDFYKKVNDYYEENSDDITIDLSIEQGTELFISLNYFAIQCRLDLDLSDKEIDKRLFERSKKIIDKTGSLVSEKQEKKFKSDTGKSAFEIVLENAQLLNSKGIIKMKVNDIYEEIIKTYPDFKKSTIRVYMTSFSTNHSSKKHYPRPKGRENEDWFEYDNQEKVFKYIKE